MKFSDVLRAVAVVLASGRVPLLTSSPGIGKSALLRQWARMNNHDCVVLFPSVLDPTDIGGLPIPDGKGRLTRALDSVLDALTGVNCPPTLLVLDELGQAPSAVQAACAPILLDRTIAGKQLGKNVKVAAATNRVHDQSGVSAFLSHIISRVVTLPLDADLDEYCAHAIESRVNSAIPAFMRLRPTLLAPWTDDTATRAATGQPYPCPRTWVAAGALLSQSPSQDIVLPLLSGTVGEGAAGECVQYLSAAATVDIDQWLAQPTKQKVPTQLSHRYALATGLAYHTTAESSDAILTVADRLLSPCPEIAALLVRDAFRVFSGLGGHPAWLSRSKGRLGDILRTA